MLIDGDEFGWTEITLEMVQDKGIRLWHGTKADALQSIITLGLIPGGLDNSRLHTHCSDHPPAGIKVAAALMPPRPLN